MIIFSYEHMYLVVIVYSYTPPDCCITAFRGCVTGPKRDVLVYSIIVQIIFSGPLGSFGSFWVILEIEFC